MQEAENPIKKIPVVVTGLEAEVHIDNIEPLAEAGDGGGALQANNNNHGSYQAYLMALHSRLSDFHRDMQELCEENNRLANRNYQPICAATEPLCAPNCSPASGMSTNPTTNYIGDCPPAANKQFGHIEQESTGPLPSLE